MENVKVLSIDQEADSRADAPKVAQTVTLETDAEGAQKLALATSLGRLSLLLRGAGDEEKVKADELSGSDFDAKKPKQDPKQESGGDNGLASFFKQEKKFVTVRVIRGDKEIAHTVPILNPDEDATGNIKQ
jgi:pilus assembly protein CpaB